MKILLAVRSLNVGGTERQVVALARALKAENCEVHIALTTPGGEFESDLRSDNDIEIHVLGGSGLSRLIRLRKLVKRQRYDVVYGFLPNMNLLLLATRMMRHRPLIAWGVRSANLDLRQYPRFVRLAYRLEKVFSRFADVIITNSRAAGLEYKSRRYRTRQIASVPNAIDTGRFAPNPAAKQAVTRELGIPPDSIIIGIFGRIHPIKDHRTFLDAADLLLKKRPDVQFLIVGGISPGLDSYGTALKNSSVSGGSGSNVHWLGQRLDPESLMAACDLTTLTSTAEGFPNAIAESMACSTPVVSTDVGDAAVIIGDTGRVVEPKNPRALADSWGIILDMPAEERRSLGDRARSSIIERFSPAEIARMTLATLEVK